MPKSDKELTIDVVNTFIEAWFSRPTATAVALQADAVTDLIQQVHKTISSLPHNCQPE